MKIEKYFLKEFKTIIKQFDKLFPFRDTFKRKI